MEVVARGVVAQSLESATAEGRTIGKLACESRKEAAHFLDRCTYCLGRSEEEVGVGESGNLRVNLTSRGAIYVILWSIASSDWLLQVTFESDGGPWTAWGA